MAQYRSTDQPINRSTDQPINRLGSKFFCVVVALSAIGCDLPSNATTTDFNLLSSESVERIRRSDVLRSSMGKNVIDIGVILPGRPSYLCWPIERLGLEPNTEILRVESSCQCVQPSVVRYRTGAESIANAIMLEVVSEDPEQSAVNERPPIDLGVAITLSTLDGLTHQFTLNLLQVQELE